MVNFRLVPRYRVIYEDGTQEELNIVPEKCYYFFEQETEYLALAVSTLERVNEIKEVHKYFKKISCVPYEIVIGV